MNASVFHHNVLHTIIVHLSAWHALFDDAGLSVAAGAGHCGDDEAEVSLGATQVLCYQSQVLFSLGAWRMVATNTELVLHNICIHDIHIHIIVWNYFNVSYI